MKKIQIITSALLLWFVGVYTVKAALVRSLPSNGVVYSVRDFGAKGDGKSTDSPYINQAIDAAAANGGGTVYFPAGNYLCYSIRLKSNIALYLDQGATIVAAEPTEKEGYDEPEPNLWGDSLKYQDYGHSHWHNSLIWGEHLENISILGPGLIWGKGLIRSTKGPQNSGNKAISLKWCRNVIIRDISMLHGGWFAILATGVDNFTIDNVKIDTNRDGMDIDCCVNVHISNCSVNSPFDDGICLKSSYGLGVFRATENVTITNCLVSGYDEGSFLDGTFKRNERKAYHDGPTGRIKFGTESNGGFKNITISNCVFDYCRGLALETVDGGLLEDVTITNITMRDIVNAPFFLRLGARMRGPENTPVGELRRVIISNVVVYNADPTYGSIISGVPGHPIRDVKLDNIRIYYKGGGTSEQADRVVPEFEKGYPEPSRFGAIPAYGFFIRHTDSIQINNVEISYLNNELRPPFILDQVNGATFRFVKAQKNEGVPFCSLKNVSDFFLFQSFDINEKKVDHTESDKL
ncbi:MAG TPA: glycoside hydrolase family 28 protein [Bacteroidales bacterium]